MMICVTATGNTLDTDTDPSFGRAPWLLLVDPQTLAFEAVENSGMGASQGAGIAAAQIISRKGAQALLTGRVGPKARAALEAAGIAIHEETARMPVREAASRFNSTINRHSGVSASQTGSRIRSGPGLNPGGRDGSGMTRCGGSGMGRGSGGRCRFNTVSGKGDSR